ncbi:hypothetical protein BCR34DRAFT_90366 [Clohesyomyces aquaticus]|uniref:N-acetylgalactosaminide beta-1,3-galactosyltransferase n=1 Tax=Clohesyomyces aquaticus TaxID=1231657 RepID=A0A1Y1YUY8_9PLEO|nr:hypothetical protein BCR34DRAFT_90366 [Clohesyomyces aquaticus]
MFMMSAGGSKFSRRPLRFLVPVVVFLLVAYSLSKASNRTRSVSASSPSQTYYSKKTKSFFPPLSSPSIGDPNPDFCQGFPTQLLEDVQIVLKTSAMESEKLKAHLATVTSCIENLIIVSDHEERLGEHHHVLDILAELPDSYAVNSSEFAAYQDEGRDMVHSREAWKLDRFKFLPMVDKAHDVAPNAKWYVFLESDVYYFWDTLFRLLDQLDHREPHYMGSPTSGTQNRYFASGAAGFVISQGLMKKLHPKVGSKSEDWNGEMAQSPLSVRYEDWIKEDCCGDAVLGYAILNATGTRMESLFPTFSGEQLKAVKVDRERWCVPLLSLHKMSPENMESLWKWERTRPFTEKAFVYSTLLSYTHSHLRDSPQLSYWDNQITSAPQPNNAPCHKSAASCASECAKDDACLQWSYSQTVCRFAPYVSLGNSVNSENGGQGEFVSGWDTEKMEELGWRAEAEADGRESCGRVAWVKPRVGEEGEVM